MAARSLDQKCSLLADSQGGRNGPEFTSVNTLLVMRRTESWTTCRLGL